MQRKISTVERYVTEGTDLAEIDRILSHVQHPDIMNAIGPTGSFGKHCQFLQSTCRMGRMHPDVRVVIFVLMLSEIPEIRESFVAEGHKGVVPLSSDSMDRFIKLARMHFQAACFFKISFFSELANNLRLACRQSCEYTAV